MKRLLAIALLCSVNFMAGAQTIRFMAHRSPQAEFAGIYMALEKGFYQDEDLDVEISHPKGSTFTYLEKGYADIVSNQLVSAMVAKSNGADLVNVLQTSQNSGLVIVTKDKISSVKDLEGMNIGIKKNGFSEIAKIYMEDNGINVNWVETLNPGRVFNAGALDACLGFSYRVYLEILFAKGRLDPSQVIWATDLGYNFPEDALFTTSEYLQKRPDIVRMFTEATKRGWEYAREHPDEAIDVVMRYAKESNVITNKFIQKKMLEEILRLQVNPNTNTCNFAPVSKEDFDKIMNSLYTHGFCPSIVEYKDLIK